MATEAKSIPRFEIRPLTEVEGGGYLVEFPDYPGCVADGATPEEALREGIDALTSYCRTLDELGRPVPTTGEVYGGQLGANACPSPFTPPSRGAQNAKAFRSTLWRRQCSRRGWVVGGGEKREDEAQGPKIWKVLRSLINNGPTWGEE